MKFFGEPNDVLMGGYGPPTAFQPQWTGQGFKHLVFDTSPVAHVIAPDGVHHQMINIYPEQAHLPVESALANIIKETGYNPAEFRIPEHQTHWDYLGEQFGFPDSRPGSMGQPIPPPQGLGRAMGAINPFSNFPPQGRIREASESTLPRKPR